MIKEGRLDSERVDKSLHPFKFDYTLEEEMFRGNGSRFAIYHIDENTIGKEHLLLITGSGFRKNLFRNGMRSNQSIGHRKIGKKMRSWKTQRLPCRKWQDFYDILSAIGKLNVQLE